MKIVESLVLDNSLTSFERFFDVVYMHSFLWSVHVLARKNTFLSSFVNSGDMIKLANLRDVAGQRCQRFFATMSHAEFSSQFDITGLDFDPDPDFVILLSTIGVNTETGSHLQSFRTHIKSLVLASDCRKKSGVLVRIILTSETGFLFFGKRMLIHSKPDIARLEAFLRNDLVLNCINFEFVDLAQDLLDNPMDWLYKLSFILGLESGLGILRWMGRYSSTIPLQYLHDRKPIVSIQWATGNRIDKYSHILLPVDFNQANSRKPDSRWRPYQYPHEVLPKRSIKPSPPFNFEKETLYVVSALRGGRLEKSLLNMDNDQFNELLDSIFCSNSLTLLILIGISEPASFLLALQEKHGINSRLSKIRALQDVPCLRTMYEGCDLYIHLPGMLGGGMGVAMAIAEKIPVLCYEGDPLMYIEPTTIPSDWGSYLDHISKLVKSSVLRSNYAELQNKFYHENRSVSYSGNQILSYFDEAAKHLSEK